MRFQVYMSDVKDEKIIKYIQSKDDNFSKYVRKLIEQDMNNNYPLTKEEIIKLIKEHTKNDSNFKEKKNIQDLFG